MRIIKKLLPLLIFYIFLIIIIPPKNTAGDDARYLKYAENLAHGFYEDTDKILLTNPPGYPTVLVPFVYFKVSLLFPKLFNAFLMFFATLFFYKTLNFFSGDRFSLFVTYCFGLYPGYMLFLSELYTEIFSIFLMCGFIYYFLALFNNTLKLKNIFLSSLFLSILILTKSIFGYVLIILLLISVIAFIFRKNLRLKSTLIVLSLSFLFCIPYLVYTYTLTNHLFYWSSNGGDTLYWISTPYPNEYGDWFTFDKVKKFSPLLKNHGAIADTVTHLPSVKKDIYLRIMAIKNILNDPFKFLLNWSANIGRLFFNYPYSYLSQRMTTYFYILPNMFIVVFIIICAYLSFIRWKLIPFEIKMLLLISFIYIGGSSILSAVFRYIVVILPPLLIWIAYILTNVIKIELPNINK